MIRSISIALLSLAALPAAGDFSLALPLDCTLGDTCHIQQTVDHDPTEAAADFMCGPQTYDGHKGTDIALVSLAAQADGVNVLAAVPGTVRGIRDDMDDVLQGTAGAPDVTGRDCGNGVVISHGDGWETQYCHMEKGSINVQSGQRVAMGQVLGKVGLSGRTQFPHLHLSVRKYGAVIDPFVPEGAANCGDMPKDTLWNEDVPFEPGGVISVGFSDAIPQYLDVKAGPNAPETLPVNSAALVVWGYAFGGRADDKLMLTITGPDGEVFSHTADVARNQSQFFRAGGKKRPAGNWAPGTYIGTVALVRDGDVLDTATANVTLTP